MLRPKSSRAGFSLVEITLAIGIVAFVLAAIIGFFGVSADSTLNSKGDTLMVSMINQVMSDMRSLPFDVLYETNPRGANPGTVNPGTGVGAYLVSLPVLAPTPAPATQTSDYYFSDEGVLLLGLTPASHAGALYHCAVTKTMDEGTKGFDTGNTKYNRMQLTLRFDWPVPTAATTSGPSTRTTYASIARYF